MFQRVEINEEVIYEIIKRVSKSSYDKKYEDYRYCGKMLLSLLFEIKKKDFIENVEIKPKRNSYLFIDENGEIEIYGLKLTKKI